MAGPLAPLMKFSVCQANNCTEIRFAEISDYGGYWPSDITKVELTVEKPTAYSSGVMNVTDDIVKKLTGTMGSAGTTITGVGTLFTSELVVGDRIYVASVNEYYTIASITSDTVLTTSVAGSAFAGQAGYRKRETIVVDPTDLGMSGTFPDGAYYMFVIYTMDSDGTTWSWEREFFFHCHVTCGVFTMLGKVPEYYTCNNCNNEFITSATTVHGLYMAMLWHAAKCNFIQAAAILATLNSILEFNKCNCE